MKKKRFKSSTKVRYTPLTVIMLVLLVVYTAIIIWLLIWALMNSFKSQAEFRVNISGLPKQWVWNYSFIYENFFIRVPTAEGEELIGILQLYGNSLLYSIGCAFVATFFPCITAYVCARFPFRFGKVIYTIVIVTMILPLVGTIPSELQIAKGLGLYDSIWGIWIMKCSFQGMYYLVFYNFFKNIPKDYTEAAKVDGAGNFRILFKIMFPLVRNLFLTVMLIMFVGFWNEYQVALLYLPSHPTVGYGLYWMANRSENNGLNTIPMKLAASVMTLLPILILFIFTHKKLMGNVSIGGIKG